MISLKKLIGIGVLFFSVIAHAAAQSIENDSSAPKEHEMRSWTAGLGLSYLVLDDVVTAEQQVGENAFSLDVFATYYFSSRFAVTGGISLISFDDKAEFEETVLLTGEFTEDVETVSSDASGIYLFTELQYLIAPVDTLPFQLKAGLGFGTIATADRGIDNCIDCREDDIDLDGGAYVTGDLVWSVADGQYNIGLNAKQYFSGDIENAAGLMFEYVF